MNERSRTLAPADVPEPSSTFSAGIATDSLVFVSGQLGIDLTTRQVPDDVREEAALAFGYVEKLLAAAELSMHDVVKTTLFVTDFDDYAAVNEVYAEHFPRPFPARSTVKVAGLLAGARLEIEAIAVRP